MFRKMFLMVLFFCAVLNTYAVDYRYAGYSIEAYYSFNDANDLTIDDSGHGLTLVDEYDGADVEAVDGRFGGAADFAGATGKAYRVFSSPGYTPFPVNLDRSVSFSLSLWVKPDTSNSDLIISPWATTSGYAVRIADDVVDTYGVWTYSDSGNFGISGSTVTVGQWTHLVMTFEVTGNRDSNYNYPGVLRVYRNGQYVGQEPNAVYKRVSNSLLIGRRGTSGFDGKIDEIALYSGVISAAEVSRLYNGIVSDEDVILYAAPTATGAGTGFSASDAMAYNNDNLWTIAQEFLATGKNVEVRLAGGTYTSDYKLVDMGSANAELTVSGQADSSTVFSNARFPLEGVINTTYKNINFTGTITEDTTGTYRGGYSHYVGTSESRVSRDVIIENCSWQDMTVVFATTGVHDGSYNVTYKDCSFIRVGPSSAEHMIYNAYDVHHVSVVDSYFEDCTGDYIRFRDGADYGMVLGCQFKSTAAAYDYSFISIPAFSGEYDPSLDYLPNNFLFMNNTFEFNGSGSETLAAINISHKGFDPLSWNYLMTAEEGLILETGSVAARKELLLKNCNVNMDEFRVVNNTYINNDWVAQFASHSAYGAVSKGWEGTVDISDLVNTTDSDMPCAEQIEGDLNNDCKVDIEDLFIMVSRWTADCTYPNVLTATGCY